MERLAFFSRRSSIHSSARLSGGRKRPTRAVVLGRETGSDGSASLVGLLERRIALSGVYAGLTRDQARSLYNTLYTDSISVDPGWTGNVKAGNAGTLSAAYLDAIRNRVGYFRIMAGLSGDVVLDPSLNNKSQQAALMMSANQTLSHSPPSTWRFYTADGALAAGSSNLSLGYPGLDAIDGQMEDSGSGNTFAGHRRWILYPPTKTFGAGAIPTDRSSGDYPSLVLWVFADVNSPKPSSTPDFVTWPPAGYVPYSQVYQRWSLSFTGASFSTDFSAATVTMTSDGVPLPVTVINRGNPGYGNDTLVWEPQLPALAGGSLISQTNDTTFTVTVSNLKVAGNSQPQSFSYTTTAFDPSIGANLVEFGAVEYVVGESAGGVSIDVRRIGDSTDSVDVPFATTDGTALAGSDYSALNGTLHFNAGQTGAKLWIPIFDDQVSEPDQTFSISLGQPGAGTNLGPRASTSVRIVDNIVPPLVRLVRTQAIRGRQGLNSLVLTFSDSLDARSAQKLSVYSLRLPGRDGKFGTRDDQRISLSRAQYNPSARTVTVSLSRPFRGRQRMQLQVTAANLRDVQGRPLDGNGDGSPGGNALLFI